MTVNRYMLPTEEGRDAESVNLCDDCLAGHPQAEQLEWLESQPHYVDCDGEDCEENADA